jgi:hypothetical protein
MSIAEFEAEDFRPLAEVGFAELRGEGYYACGAEVRFAWYLQRCRAGRERSNGKRDDNGRFISSGTASELNSAGDLSIGTIIPYQPTDIPHQPTATVTVTDSNTSSSQQAARFDFEEIYKNYPRKVGKSEGIKRAKAKIKTEKDYQDLATAIERYRGYCKENGFEGKYIKQFSSFMSSWKDWLDPETGSVEGKPKARVRSIEEALAEIKGEQKNAS